MRLRSRALALPISLGLLLALAGVGSVDAAAPAPAFGIQLADDGACHFAAVASWSHAKVSEVVIAWSFGIASWQDDLTSTRGRRATATFTAGSSDTARTWSVTASFYVDGSLVGTAGDSDTVACALLL